MKCKKQTNKWRKKCDKLPENSDNCRVETEGRKKPHKHPDRQHKHTKKPAKKKADMINI